MMQEDKRNLSADALKAMAEGSLDAQDEAVGDPVEAEEPPSTSDIAVAPEAELPMTGDDDVPMARPAARECRRGA